MLPSVAAQIAANKAKKEIALSTSKMLLEPVPGEPQRTNSLPVTAALSPDGKYLALLNNGFGSAESDYRQSIAVLDLRSNRLRDFPDARLATHARQTYFLGLAWSGDGSELYASMASLTDPEGKKPGSTGNGIAVYRFADGALTPERFLKLPLASLGKDKKNMYGAKFVPAGFVSPYPAGIAVVKREAGEALLVAENLADDAVLIDARDGKVLQRFDLGHGKVVPTTFPYAVVATRDGSRGWVSLWNGSSVAELDLRIGKSRQRRSHCCRRKKRPRRPRIPRRCCSVPMRRHLYVTLGQSRPGRCDRNGGRQSRALSGHPLAGSDLRRKLSDRVGAVGRRQDALCRRLSALTPLPFLICVKSRGPTPRPIRIDRTTSFPPSGIPRRWQSRAAIVQWRQGREVARDRTPEPRLCRLPGNKLQHPYIASMIRGSIARVNLQDAERDHEALTAEVVRATAWKAEPTRSPFSTAAIPSGT